MKTQLLLIIFLTSLSVAQDSTCLSYEPKVEKVFGRIERVSFPGAPNFENVQKGDSEEICWILKLKSEICVTGKIDDVNDPESEVTEIQLVLDKSQYSKYSKFVGKNVIVVGTLFHSVNAHHKTSVLILVKNISAG